MKKLLLAPLLMLSSQSFAETAVICEKTSNEPVMGENQIEGVMTLLNSRLKSKSVLFERFEWVEDKFVKKNVVLGKITSVSAPSISQVGKFIVLCVTVQG